MRFSLKILSEYIIAMLINDRTEALARINVFPCHTCAKNISNTFDGECAECTFTVSHYERREDLVQ